MLGCTIRFRAFRAAVGQADNCPPPARRSLGSTWGDLLSLGPFSVLVARFVYTYTLCTVCTLCLFLCPTGHPHLVVCAEKKQKLASHTFCSFLLVWRLWLLACYWLVQIGVYDVTKTEFNKPLLFQRRIKTYGQECTQQNCTNCTRIYMYKLVLQAR